MHRLPALLLSGLALTSPSLAGIELSDLFAPHMVFQREAPIQVWGTADAEANVTVSLIQIDGGGGESILATAGATAGMDGNWQLSLAAQTATSDTFSHALAITDGVTETRISPVHVGDVWICSGQSNMNFLMRPYLPWSEGVLNWEASVAAAGDPQLNIFTVVPEADWKEADSVHGSWRPDNSTLAGYFSAVPYLFGREIRREAGVPVGIIVASLGGTSVKHWMHIEALQDIPAAQADIALHEDRRVTYATEIETYYQTTLPAYWQQSIENHWEPTYAAPYSEPYNGWRYQPGGLYHAMLAPLEAFPVRGTVWYQGESDSSKHATYLEFLTALIDSWRTRRGDPDMPFLIVQLHNYDPVLTGSDPATFTDVWADLREAQATAAATTANTGMVVAADVGNPINIHPRDKQTVADRLGLVARRLAYGDTAVVDSGPVLSSFLVEGGTFLVTFSHTEGGMVIDTGRATGTGPSFQLAGADAVFHDADYVVTGSNRIELSSAAVPAPVYLNYAYHNDPTLILYNGEGLPAAPFRISLPEEDLAAFGFDASDFAAALLHSSLEAGHIAPGPGATNFSYNSTRGSPPPSFFIRSTSTPDTLEAAVAGDVYLELGITCHPGYLLDFSTGGLRFDIARSTTLGDFFYAVRSSLDNYQANLAQDQILTLNETFGSVFVPLAPRKNLSEVTFRIYIWDNLNDSTRVTRFDSLRVSGMARFRPQTEILPTLGPAAMVLRWQGAPGRNYRILSAPGLDFSAPSVDQLLSDPVPESGLIDYAVPFTGPARFFRVEEITD